MEKHLLDSVSKFTLEEIHSELYQIKKDLIWLDSTIALTRDQRQIYNDINNRINKLLGCNR